MAATASFDNLSTGRNLDFGDQENGIYTSNVTLTVRNAAVVFGSLTVPYPGGPLTHERPGS